MSYQINCSQDDDFMVKSNDEQEVIAMTKEHAREKHDMDMDDEQVREMIHQS